MVCWIFLLYFMNCLLLVVIRDKSYFRRQGFNLLYVTLCTNQSVYVDILHILHLYLHQTYQGRRYHLHTFNLFRISKYCRNELVKKLVTPTIFLFIGKMIN